MLIKTFFHHLSYEKKNFSNPQNGILFKMEQETFRVCQIIKKLKKVSFFGWKNLLKVSKRGKNKTSRDTKFNIFFPIFKPTFKL